MEDRKKQVRLRIKLYKEQKNLMQNHVAAIAAFCVANGIELAEGLELSNELFAILANQLIKRGTYDKVKRDYQKDLEIIKEMQRQQGKRRAEP